MLNNSFYRYSLHHINHSSNYTKIVKMYVTFACKASDTKFFCSNRLWCVITTFSLTFLYSLYVFAICGNVICLIWRSLAPNALQPLNWMYLGLRGFNLNYSDTKNALTQTMPVRNKRPIKNTNSACFSTWVHYLMIKADVSVSKWWQLNCKKRTNDKHCLSVGTFVRRE